MAEVWIWTVDEQLLNLKQVEMIELLEVFDEGATPEDLDTEVEPGFYELVAYLPSDREVVLFEHEDGDLARRAYELLASWIAANDGAGAGQAQPVSLSELIEASRRVKN